MSTLSPDTIEELKDHILESMKEEVEDDAAFIDIHTDEDGTTTFTLPAEEALTVGTSIYSFFLGDEEAAAGVNQILTVLINASELVQEHMIDVIHFHVHDFPYGPEDEEAFE